MAFPSTFISLLRAREGSVLIFVVMGIVTLLIAIGAAVDMARYQTLQSTIAHALDVSGFAAKAALNAPLPTAFPDNCQVQTNAKPEQQKLVWALCQTFRYFNANIPPQYLENNLQQPIDLNVIRGGSTPDCPTPRTLCMTAHAVQKTTFMRVLGISQMTVDAAHTVTGISTP